jgi:hypothetical protein
VILKEATAYFVNAYFVNACFVNACFEMPVLSLTNTNMLLMLRKKYFKGDGGLE